MMGNTFKQKLLDFIALLFCFCPAAIVTIQCFPKWRGGVGFIPASGGAIAVLTIMAVLIITRYTKVRMPTPSPLLMALILLGLSLFIEKTISDFVLIITWLVIGSAIGALFFMWADKYKERKS